MTSKKLIAAVSIGAVILTLGIVFVPCFPLIYKHILDQNMVIEDGTQGYRAWQNIPLPIYMNFYFFNVTNTEDFIQNGSKPHLKQVGPYVYRSWWVRKNIQWFGNDTVTARQVKKYVYMANMSEGKDSDVVTTLNVPLITLGTWLQKYPEIVKQISSRILEKWFHEELFIHKPVKSLIFDGYPDVIALLEPFVLKNMPASHGKFAFFIGRNNSDDGEFLVHTGKGDMSQLNIIEKWKRHRRMPCWSGDCSKLKGSTAELNPPPNKYKKNFIFDADLCRSWGLDFREELTLLDIPVFHYVADISILQNGTTNVENSCFSTGRIVPNGAMDISPCQFGAPILLSFPHFYLADPVYRNAVTGMRPNSSLHTFYVDIETHSGLSLDFAARIQANVALEKVKSFRQLENVSEIAFPVFWQEVRVQLTTDVANELKSLILTPLFYGNLASYLLIAVGAVICVISVAFVIRAKRSENKEKPSDDGENEDLVYRS